MDRLLLTVEQVEESTAIYRSKLYEYMASGQLRSIKIGRSRRVGRTHLEAFIERLRAEQWPEPPPALSSIRSAA